MVEVSGQSHEQILYGLLGRMKKKNNWLQLMDPHSSVILGAQVTIHKLLSTFHADFSESPWYFMEALGLKTDDPIVRGLARAQLLQQACGIVCHQELRLGKAPYSLLILVCEDVHYEYKLHVAREAYSIPQGCLNLFMVRLRLMFPTPEQLVEHGCDVLRAFAQTAFTGVDWCERFHARMRTDLRNAGPGRNPAVSSARCFCQELATLHKNIGGNSGGSWAAAQAEPGRPKRRGVNPKLMHRNMKICTTKKLVAPNRPLNPDELARAHVRS